MMTEKNVSNIAKVWEDQNAIIHVLFLKIIDITDTEARNYIDICVNLAAGRPKNVLMDLRDVDFFTPGAFKQITGPEITNITKAVAVLINTTSPLLTTAVSLLLKLEHEPFPIQIFNNEKEATEWLLGLNKK